jgi:hypothetical protein
VAAVDLIAVANVAVAASAIRSPFKNQKTKQNQPYFALEKFATVDIIVASGNYSAE